MKKIMFSDKYGLTQAVLELRKKNTRRQDKSLDNAIEKYEETYKTPFSIISQYYDSGLERLVIRAPDEPIYIKPRYLPGEVVAVAQSYEDAGYYPMGRKDEPGWRNKMFVRADLMPHQIRITNVRVERLWDISDEDCIREGIEEDSPYYWVPVNKSLPNWRKIVEGVSDMYPNDRDGKVYPHFWDSPRKAFAALIDKISGKGTWDANAYFLVYEFELIK